MPEISGPRPTDPNNGWRQVSVWTGNTTTGDYTVGEEVTAYYELVGTAWRAEHTCYVTARGYIDGEWKDLEVDDLPIADGIQYAVEERFECWYEHEGEQLDHEHDYEGGSYLSYDTLDGANAEAIRMAKRDTAFCFAPRDLFDGKTAELAKTYNLNGGTA